MKFQLDFKTKEIKIDESVNLKEFTDYIQKYIPDWEEWTLALGPVNPLVQPVSVPNNNVLDWWQKQPWSGEPYYTESPPGDAQFPGSPIVTYMVNKNSTIS